MGREPPLSKDTVEFAHQLHHALARVVADIGREGVIGIDTLATAQRLIAEGDILLTHSVKAAAETLASGERRKARNTAQKARYHNKKRSDAAPSGGHLA